VRPHYITLSASPGGLGAGDDGGPTLSAPPRLRVRPSFPLPFPLPFPIPYPHAAKDEGMGKGKGRGKG
jgi:hypothetical protein